MTAIAAGSHDRALECPLVTSELTESSDATRPAQAEMPFAIVQGTPLTELPRDLYIPPDALEVFLEAFEGPLDLLLYLIKRQNLDVLDIPIARITHQYMRYIELMQVLQIELAAEYLVMAAMLAEIKSRMLLPRPASDAEEDDPRAELVRRLQEYERYKQAASELDALPRLERELHLVVVEFSERSTRQLPPTVSLEEMLAAMKEVVERAELFTNHQVQREALSVRERMAMILDLGAGGEFVEFTRFFEHREGRLGVVVTLLAILELLKEALIEMVQNEPQGPIYVKVAA
ncbi:MAG: segregation/condensation protein A [Gammaproteobacteria bacterium]|nr:segregation/condensation protein A [Gammaproteobacteria bacterium]